ncbi:hypothetical protein RBS60_03095 [Sinomonas sp. ASV486]|uniref:hypothetical protein n=1 Tax=Sinomonas sp. ASV486 TaxID=3051170 RepID=UPI0027DD31B6|nr:hypothetical protein [Sinomonas sp. ASV486]MDQ4489181.1 hypothetical protein [Sinomonas sp. ASV486]
MPKSRTRKPKNTRPRTATPLGEYERRRRSVDLMVDRLTPDYIAWASQGEDDLSAFATGQLLVVKMFVTIVSSLGKGAPTLRLDPDQVAGFLPPFLDDVAASADPEDAAVDDQRYVVGTLVDWLSFLEETGRWEGTADELEAVAEVLDTEAEKLGGIVDASPRDGLPEATEEEAAEFAASAPFVQHARALLGWLGAGRETTPDATLSEDSLATAAEIVGSPDRARRLWEAMVNAELVDVTGGSARPGEGAADLGNSDGLGQLEAQFLGTEIVVAACTDGTPGTLEGETAAVLTTILTAAVHQEPFPLDDVVSLGADPSGLNVHGDDLGVEEELGPDASQQLKGLAEGLLTEIRELEALGLLTTADGMVSVPVAALDAVYDAVVDYEGGEADDEDEQPLDYAALDEDGGEAADDAALELADHPEDAGEPEA